MNLAQLALGEGTLCTFHVSSHGGGALSIGSAEFKEWLSSSNLSTSASDLSKVTGISRATLRNQLLRGSVPETTVVEICRASSLDPLEGLGSFRFYEDLVSGTKKPTEDELISQTHVADLMAEFLWRTSKGYRATFTPRPAMVPFPHDGSVRAWIEAIDPGDLRKSMSRRSGVATSNIATQLTNNKLTPSLAYTAAQLSNVSMASGFVVSGLLTQGEGRWPVRAREEAVMESTDQLLVDSILSRLTSLSRKISNRTEALDEAQRMAELLG